ncbi:pyrimidine dimer DNA glycosylase/endonuclease V [Campylobacter suis]|uniref:DNA lyase n=1 Tax=Campylobacter suis TaxID=2790657 RepID=A0ABM8Q0R7_9BACT|nr:pyrimidine dimer DNA glycosylase/endonuclease V [Campylobacter suis]CAD7286352.1 hypothetical protein LMG8286_00183 [Campylobacter suis]
MRLWSVDFAYLDAKGLVALWRETLLAKHVILGLTKGYKNHPQLDRFYAHEKPILAIDAYLYQIWLEATKRGYKFDLLKIGDENYLKSLASVGKIAVTSGQICYEFEFLQTKLKTRDELKFKQNKSIKQPRAMSLFEIRQGDIEPWEKVKI